MGARAGHDQAVALSVHSTQPISGSHPGVSHLGRGETAKQQNRGERTGTILPSSIAGSPSNPGKSVFVLNLNVRIRVPKRIFSHH